jgi:hypothetical protein
MSMWGQPPPAVRRAKVDRIWLVEEIERLSKTGFGNGMASAEPESSPTDEGFSL